MDGYTGIVELFSIVVAAVGTIVGFLWAAIRIGSRMYRVLPAVDRLHDVFGESPVHELHQIISELRTTVGEFEIRQRIAERHLKIGIYVCGPAGQVTWANDYLCDAFGLDSTEILDNGGFAAIDKKDRARMFRAWRDCVENGLPFAETYLVTPCDGKPSWQAETQAWPVIRDAKVICYVGCVKHSEVNRDSKDGATHGSCPSVG